MPIAPACPEAGSEVMNGWCSTLSPVTAEIVARTGHGTVAIDPILLAKLAVGEVIATLRDEAVHTCKLASIHCGSPGMVRQTLDRGFHLALLLTDARMFANIMATALAKARNIRATFARGQY